MTPERVRALRAEVQLARDALLARPFDETLAALGRVLESWRDPHSAWRVALEEELPSASGFSRETVRAGLDLAFEGWTADALASVARAELPERREGAPLTTLILGGALPMPSLLSMLAPLVLRSPILAKPGSHDRVTPRLVARSLLETDALLGDCAAVIDVRSDDAACMEVLLESECVVATGSDETLDALRARMERPERLIEHGHRLSLAALGPEACGAALAAHAEALALDVAHWDQLGCLSPIAVFAPAHARGAVAEALASALARVEARMPRGRVDTRSAAAITSERAEAELRAAGGEDTQVHASDDTAWTVIAEDHAAVRPAPLHRFVRVFPADGAAALLDAVAPYAAHLAGLALAGFGAEERALAERLRALGATWICAPGRLQAPPLDWPRDGHRVLASLLPRAL